MRVGPGHTGAWGCMGLNVRAGTLKLRRGQGGEGGVWRTWALAVFCSEGDALDGCLLLDQGQVGTYGVASGLHRCPKPLAF